MLYLVLKSLHLVFVVSWFAALLYAVRLLVYIAEADSTTEAGAAIKAQLGIMLRRLWLAIAWPASVLATIFGVWMMVELRLWAEPWMQVKLALVLALWVYHWVTNSFVFSAQAGRPRLSSFQFRIWNELATLWLVAIVFVVVLKSTLSWLWFTAGFFALGLLLMMAVRIYKGFRLKR